MALEQQRRAASPPRVTSWPVALLASLVVAVGCTGPVDEQDAPAAAQREAALDEPSTDVATASPAPTAAARVEAPEPPALEELTRDELDWEDVEIPVGDLELHVTRLPAGFAVSADRAYEVEEGGRGWVIELDVFDEAIRPAGGLAYLDVQVVAHDEVERAEQLQARLASREPVRTEDVRGRDAVAYRSAEQRTVRVLRGSGTVVYVRGVGLSRDALLEVAAGVRRST